MTDLYIIWTPIIGLLTIATLLSLKSTLAEPKINDPSRYSKVKSSQSPQIQNGNFQQQPIVEQNGFKKTFFYLLRNFTVLEFCTTGRGRNKIPMLLSISLIVLLCVALNISYVFSIVGSILMVSFFLIKSLSQDTEEQKEQKQIRNKETINQNNQQTAQSSKSHGPFSQVKLQIFMALTSLIANLVIFTIVYKNYYNNFLAEAAVNTVISVCLDNFVLRPVLLAVTAFSVKNLEVVNLFIEKEYLFVQVIQGKRKYQKVLDAQMLTQQKVKIGPMKIQNPNMMEIEPRLDLQNKQNYLSTIQLNKNMRKTKLSPLCLKKKVPAQEGQNSLMSILNSHEKKRKDRNISFDFDKSMHEQKVQQHIQIQDQKVLKNRSNLSQNQHENSASFYGSRKKNKLYSSKMVVVEPDTTIINGLNNQVENQEEEDIQTSIKKDRADNQRQGSLRESGFRNSANHDPLRISLHGTLEQDAAQEDQQEYYNRPRPHTTFEEDNSALSQNGTRTSRKNGLLKINEDRNGQDLSQIDLNSPERRNKNLSKIAEQSECKPKKKKIKNKKYSLDPNRHVIKHSTGEPYLEFLPNLLNKEIQEKKRKSQASIQQFSRKTDLFQSNFNQNRHLKSVKGSKNRGPIVRQNDENQIPQFVIEDFD